MTTRITARFSDQLAAASAVDKLLSRGVSRDHVTTRMDESLGDTPVPTGAPTTVVPGASREDRGSDKPDGKLERSRLPQYGTDPARFGHVTVTVAIQDQTQDAAIRDCLTAAGGRLRDAAETSDETSGAPDNASSTDTDVTAEPDDDVQRAIDASRRGASLR